MVSFGQRPPEISSHCSSAAALQVLLDVVAGEWRLLSVFEEHVVLLGVVVELRMLLLEVLFHVLGVLVAAEAAEPEEISTSKEDVRIECDE